MPIKVQKPTPDMIQEMKKLPTWSKEPSVFDWQYDAEETCFLIEGDVTVTTEAGEAVSFGAGDLVTFPRGLKCTWTVRRPVYKHYRFG
ncbi:MAG: DUF861 domain-containing protein [Rhodospirillales bacterium]|nr:MAG: DUF861 domain-containing protein [Rhodospirillales bacterium]